MHNKHIEKNFFKDARTCLRLNKSIKFEKFGGGGELNFFKSFGRNVSVQ